MNDVIRSRLLVLAGLTVISIGLAGAGTAFGVAEPLADTGSAPEFTISGDTVTVSSGGKSDTLLSNLSQVSEIKIEETATGEFTIQTAEDEPLSQSERQQAESIAMSNATVEQVLDSMDTYELTVEPVQKVNISASNVISRNITIEENQTNGTFSGEFTINETESDTEREGVVRIRRESNYVDDRAVVRVYKPGVDSNQDLRLTVDVDLVNGTVTDILNWDTLRQNSSRVTKTTAWKSTEIAE
jgi:hypothetical protein